MTHQSPAAHQPPAAPEPPAAHQIHATHRTPGTLQFHEMLQIHEVVVTHGGRTLLDIADLTIARGRALTVVGGSGAGKSLLADAITGTLASELVGRGRTTIDGTAYNVAEAGALRPLWGRVVARLPQEPMLALDPTMRVRDLVAEGDPEFRTNRRTARSAALTSLGRLGVRHAAPARPHMLSGGMAQRVAFAAAVAGRAPVLVADEPSTGLDQTARDTLAVLLRQHVDDGGTLLTITHDLDLARALGGEVVVLRQAQIVERGPVEQVLTDPQHPYTRRLLAAEPRHWNKPWSRTTGPADSTRPLLVEARGIARRRGGRELFRDLDLDLQASDRVALTGPSGSGKTTLGDVLLRLQPTDAGRVVHRELRRPAVQKLFQDPEATFPSRVPLGVGIGDVLQRHRIAPERLEELLGAMHLDPSLLERRPGAVSGGELQRLALARAMLVRPALLLADEPTSRLDLITQEETIDLLMGQVEESGCALVTVTHHEALAEQVADRTIPVGG